MGEMKVAWVFDACHDANGFATIRFADGTENGDTDSQPIATVYDDSDASVIAAAPELLAALHAARAWVAQYSELKGHEAASSAMLRVIDAAIAKAEGRT